MGLEFEDMPTGVVVSIIRPPLSLCVAVTLTECLLATSSMSKKVGASRTHYNEYKAVLPA